MRILFVYLPIIILVVGWLLGRCRLTRAIVCLAIMMIASQMLLLTSIAKQEPAYLFLALVIAMFGIVTSVAFSFATSKQVEPPVLVAVEAYQGLDPATQDKLLRGARLAFKFGAKHVANHLRDRGHVRSAEALHQGSRLV